MQGHVVLGKYEVGRLLGRGSMGQVYLAKPRDGGRDVVVKFMHDRVASQPRFREMFASELAMMARFHHPNAVALLEGALDDPAGPCIVMEYVAGLELEKVLEATKRYEPEHWFQIALPLCQAMHAAHTAGIIHRDLKPANLMVTNAGKPGESVKVMDLGLASLAYKPFIPVAKLQGSDDAYLVGTPAYVSPEAVRGDDVDARGDLYSLGVVFFEALTGRLPFEDQDVERLLEAHAQRTPPTFRDSGLSDAPPKLEKLVQQLLSKFPVERPQNAFDVANRYCEALGMQSPDPAGFTAQNSGDDDAPSGSQPPLASNTDRIVQSIEAWMPEAVAVVKLRGFLEDLGARVAESEPGLIRVRLGEPQPEPEKPRGVMSWFVKTPPPPGPDPNAIEPVAIDLYLTRRPGNAQQLDIKTVFRALEGPLPADARWHKRTKKLFLDLKSYLMAQR